MRLRVVSGALQMQHGIVARHLPESVHHLSHYFSRAVGFLPKSQWTALSAVPIMDRLCEIVTVPCSVLWHLSAHAFGAPNKVIVRTFALLSSTRVLPSSWFVDNSMGCSSFPCVGRPTWSLWMLCCQPHFSSSKIVSVFANPTAFVRLDGSYLSW